MQEITLDEIYQYWYAYREHYSEFKDLYKTKYLYKPLNFSQYIDHFYKGQYRII
jgi:hypothetical protein